MELHPIDLLRREAPRWLAALTGRLDPVLGLLRGAPRRHLVLGGVAMLAVLTAVAVRVASSPKEAAPTDEFVGFRCEKCGEYFELSHREFEQIWEAGRYRAGGRGQTLVFECAKCGEMTARRAERDAVGESGSPPD